MFKKKLFRIIFLFVAIVLLIFLCITISGKFINKNNFEKTIFLKKMKKQFFLLINVYFLVAVM